MTDTATNDQVDTQSPKQPEQSAPSLTLQDLITVAQIIQLSSQRGAFRAEELQGIGGLYNKLIAFLQSVGALQPAEAQTEEK
jgi:hypothetical protein